ncbi:MAG: circularly permuted type 2 ATP-grasp protein [Synechococcus sp.]
MNEYKPPRSNALTPALQRLQHNLATRKTVSLERHAEEARRHLQTIHHSTRCRYPGAIASSNCSSQAWAPFDPIPRLVSKPDWERLAAGLIQRIHTLEAFLQDVYGPQLVVRDGVLPRGRLEGSSLWRPDLRDLPHPPRCWCPLATPDLIRNANGDWVVLEDNLQRGFGLGFSLAARQAQMAAMPWSTAGLEITPTPQHLSSLQAMFQSLAPWAEEPSIVMISPDYNSSSDRARQDRAVIAEALDIAIVEASDLSCDEGKLWHYPNGTRQRIDVIYRRNDERLPSKDGLGMDLLGVPGLDAVFACDAIAITNPPGVGIASDKLIYTHLPEMVRYYLNEEALLPQVPTYDCTDPVQREKVITELNTLVVKQAAGAGGVGVLIGPQASRKELEAMTARIQQTPRDYIAQPLQDLSTVPTLINATLQDCAVDLRPFVIQTSDGSTQLLDAALTRVAMSADSLIVNATQGGGFKDTWIVNAPLQTLDQKVQNLNN